ncbi:unnamed protein product [Echinostoma caproni]|uniref:ATP-binding protein n=1 Tax=Echinostoma caproni TaxID=27848 RepID=A0A183A7F9_9TREM|nr:unnamed protein product [Echinostoma caproni]
MSGMKFEAKSKEAKRLARKRYPGLIDLNARPSGPRHRLRSRVLTPRAIRKIADTLDSADQRDMDCRFSDNFQHAIKPR